MSKEIVCGLVDAGKIDEAWEATGGITDYRHRAEAALIIASTTSDPNHLEDAMALASHVPDEESRRRLENAIELIRRSA